MIEMQSKMLKNNKLDKNKDYQEMLKNSVYIPRQQEEQMEADLGLLTNEFHNKFNSEE